MDPSHPATSYAAPDSSNGHGIFKSTNGATSWIPVNSGFRTLSVNALAINPSTPATLYAGAYGNTFKSTDGAATWQRLGSSTGNGTLPATAIAEVSGDNQTDAAGQPLRYQLVAVVTNASGIPVVGVTVNFAVTAGGGTLSGTQSTTDSQGVAFTKLTLESSAGTNTVTATATGLARTRNGEQQTLRARPDGSVVRRRILL